MSKPLIFMLQLIGFILLILGFGQVMSGESPIMLLIGLILVIFGGIGWRKRIKQ